MATAPIGLIAVVLGGIIVLGGGFAIIYALMGGFRKDKPED